MSSHHFGIKNYLNFLGSCVVCRCLSCSLLESPAFVYRITCGVVWRLKWSSANNLIFGCSDWKDCLPQKLACPDISSFAVMTRLNKILNLTISREWVISMMLSSACFMRGSATMIVIFDQIIRFYFLIESKVNGFNFVRRLGLLK